MSLRFLEQNMLKCICHLFFTPGHQAVCFMTSGGLSSDHVVKDIQHRSQPLITGHNLVFTFLSGYPV